MTFRPLGARIVAYVSGVCLLIIVAAVVIELSPEIRGVFSVSQVATLTVLLLAALAVLWGVARSVVRTDEDGIHIVNGYRRHDLAWTVVVDVSMPAGAPWGTVSTVDDRELMMLAIQGSDGPRARDAIWSIREQILEHRGDVRPDG